MSLAWRSSSNGDRWCSSHLSHQCRSNVRGRSLVSISDSHVACPHRGRKRLSREATLRTLLALEWPELVQIGRCKVRWLPSIENKRNMTSFYSKKTMIQQQRTRGDHRGASQTDMGSSQSQSRHSWGQRPGNGTLLGCCSGTGFLRRPWPAIIIKEPLD